MKDWFASFGALSSTDTDYIEQYYGILQELLLAGLKKNISFKSPTEQHALLTQHIPGQEKALEFDRFIVISIAGTVCRLDSLSLHKPSVYCLYFYSKLTGSCRKFTNFAVTNLVANNHAANLRYCNDI